MKNTLPLLALAGSLAVQDGCRSHTQSARAASQCENSSQPQPTRSTIATPAAMGCATQNAEAYLRSHIAALRPSTTRAELYDRRRILMIALAEDEGEDEQILQAELRTRRPCVNGEPNVGILRTQIYGESLVEGRYYPSSVTERLVFTGMNNGQLEIVYTMTPNLPGTEHTCLPQRPSNFFRRYECYGRQRHYHYGQFPLIDWTFTIKDVPGVAICFSPDINTETICGFPALSAFVQAHNHNTETGICMDAHEAWSPRPAELSIN